MGSANTSNTSLSQTEACLEWLRSLSSNSICLGVKETKKRIKKTLSTLKEHISLASVVSV